jgi:hypothetical protein
MISIEEFKEKFDVIKSQGWLPSKRRGPTGIGQTLEQLLGLSENNIALPDLHKVELKAHRIGSSSSMITLFTFNRKAWKMKPLEAIRKYGTPDINGRMGLYFTMSPKPTGTGLFLHTENEIFPCGIFQEELSPNGCSNLWRNNLSKKCPDLFWSMR